METHLNIFKPRDQCFLSSRELSPAEPSKSSRINSTSSSAVSMICSGANCGFHPIFLPCSGVKVQLLFE